MDSMLSRGTLKGAANALGIEVSTVQVHLNHARLKMKPPHKLGHFLAWDRWRRETLAQAQQPETADNCA
jgi:hypothetical protein